MGRDGEDARRTGGLDARSGGLTNFLVDGSSSVLDTLGEGLVGDWGAGEGAHLAEKSLADERHGDVVVEVVLKSEEAAQMC